jgi:hypothetical protein
MWGKGRATYVHLLVAWGKLTGTYAKPKQNVFTLFLL